MSDQLITEAVRGVIDLGTPQNAPSNTTQQQALQQVHQGLTQAPFGQLFEGLFQMTLDSLGKNIDLSGQTLQQAHQANENTSELPGAPHESADGFFFTIAQNVWQFIPPEGFGGTPASTWLTEACDYGIAARVAGGIRLLKSRNFIMNLSFNGTPPQNVDEYPDLSEATQIGALRAPSVLAYLQDLYPAYGWENNHNGTIYVGATIAGTFSGFNRDYFWIPEAPSLAEIYHLFDYQPNAGPTRNGIDDFRYFLTLTLFTT